MVSGFGKRLRVGGRCWRLGGVCLCGGEVGALGGGGAGVCVCLLWRGKRKKHKNILQDQNNGKVSSWYALLPVSSWYVLLLV